MSKVSIIVPVHNSEKTVRRCVESIQSQTLKDIEILLVENGSSDNSLEISRDLARNDGRIQVLSLPTADLSTARNQGVKTATSDYIGFVDSDDRIAPTLYEDAYGLAVKEDLDLVNFNYVKKYPGKKDRYPFPQDGSVRILSAPEMTRLNFYEHIPRTVCSMLYRKELFKSSSFPERMYYEDRASTFLFMAQARKSAVINKAYYYYYQGDGTISHTRDYWHFRDHVKSDCMRLEFINASGMFSDEEKPRIAFHSADLLLRKLRHMIVLSDTAEKKNETREWCRKIDLIPEGTRLTFKTTLVKFYIRYFILDGREPSCSSR